MLRKKCILLVVMVALLAVVNANAESTMTFVAGGDVCTPMTVTVGGEFLYCVFFFNHWQC